MSSRMFPFVSDTCNPLGGRCPHGCLYCWSMGERGLANRYRMEKYKENDLFLVCKELDKRFPSSSFVFVQDMSDLFAESVRVRWILKVIDWMRVQPNVEFLLLSKNPNRYVRFVLDQEFPVNVVLGATVETNCYKFTSPVWARNGAEIEHWINYCDISKAPYPKERLDVFKQLSEMCDLRLFVSVEPILDFTDSLVLGKNFLQMIEEIKPWAVAVGYDNYGYHLPEPELSKTLKLVDGLEKFTKVYRKSLRRAWWETEK